MCDILLFNLPLLSSSMELMDFAILAGLCLLFSGVTSGLWSGILWQLRDFSLTRRVKSLEDELYSMQQTERSALGVKGKAEKAGRIAMAEAEIGAALAAGKQPMDILKEIGPKYMDIAPDLIKKYSKAMG